MGQFIIPKYGTQTRVGVWSSYTVCFTAYFSAGIECMCIYLCIWTSWKVWWAVACQPCHQALHSGRCPAPCSRSSPSQTATACGSRSAEGWPPKRCNTGGFEHFITTWRKLSVPRNRPRRKDFCLNNWECSLSYSSKECKKIKKRRIPQLKLSISDRKQRSSALWWRAAILHQNKGNVTDKYCDECQMFIY